MSSFPFTYVIVFYPSVERDVQDRKCSQNFASNFDLMSFVIQDLIKKNHRDQKLKFGFSRLSLFQSWMCSRRINIECKKATLLHENYEIASFAFIACYH